MIITDGSKCFRRRFHGVTPQSAVHMKVDEAGCKVISVKIKNLSRTRTALLADRGDFSLFNNNLKAITNAIGENQTRVTENHFDECSMFNLLHSTTIEAGLRSEPAKSILFRR
jgi:hypothetical protein